MKKLLSILMVVSILSACSSAPIIKPEPVHGLLNGTKDVSVSFQYGPVRSGAVFDTHGYTIIGVAYVAAAIQKMKVQSNEVIAAQAQYLKEHPGVLSLKDTFDHDLEASLVRRGLNVSEISVAKKVDANKEVSYEPNPSEVKTRWVVVVDGLASQYWAPSSTDNYKPQSAAVITLLDNDNPSAKPIHIVQQDNPKPEDESYSYSNFDELSKDTGKSYDGLKKSIARLADQTAKFLMENETKKVIGGL